MRHLFDTKKEHKSLKLVKKLQEEADQEWQKEVAKRKAQEENDEAIAKELQAQLEQEQDKNNPFVQSSSPPPLPVKPQAYNQDFSSKKKKKKKECIYKKMANFFFFFDRFFIIHCTSLWT